MSKFRANRISRRPVHTRYASRRTSFETLEARLLLDGDRIYDLLGQSSVVESLGRLAAGATNAPTAEVAGEYGGRGGMDANLLSGRVVELNDQPFDGASDVTHEYVVKQDGIVTVQIFFAESGTDLDVEVSDLDGNPLASSAQSASTERVDLFATASDQLMIRVFSTNGGANTYDLKITNALSRRSGSELVVRLTGRDDFILAGSISGDIRELDVVRSIGRGFEGRHGTTYDAAIVDRLLGSAPLSSLFIRGGRGDDTLTIDGAVQSPTTILGNKGDDSITGGSGADLIRPGQGADDVDGGAGSDTAEDLTEEDHFEAIEQLPALEFDGPAAELRGTVGVPFRHEFCQQLPARRIPFGSTAVPVPSEDSDLCGGPFIGAQPVTATISPRGGIRPYHFQLDSGVGFPPLGITLNVNGLLAGVPSIAGQSTFRVCAVDVRSDQACQNVQITVEDVPLPDGIEVTPANLSIDGPVCFFEPCLLTATVVVASSVSWEYGGGCFDPIAEFSREVSACPDSGGPGRTVVVTSTMIFGESTPRDFEERLTRGRRVRFQQPDGPRFADLSFVVVLPYAPA